jgi:phosphoglycerol transferase
MAKEQGSSILLDIFSEDRTRNIIPFFAFILLLAMLFRDNSGVLASIFDDEYSYSLFSRLEPPATSPFPNYIYLAIYRLTNTCGGGFLNCARILNDVFFLAATPFIYLTARRVCTIRVASIVSLLAVLGPINNCTVYYMPEALYFFSFWLCTWFILGLDNTSSPWSWCLSGMMLGIAALVKPHALLLLPGILLFVLYVGRRKNGGWILRAGINSIGFFVCALLIKFLIGYLIAGTGGLTLFGSFYHSYVSTAVSATPISQRYVDFFVLAMESIKGHVLAICLLFGLPVTLAIYASSKSRVFWIFSG